MVISSVFFVCFFVFLRMINDKAQSFQLIPDYSPDYGLRSMLDPPVHTRHYKSIAGRVFKREFKVMDHEMENEFPFLQILTRQLALLSA